MAIDIKVTDGVDSSISTKLLAIASGAGSAQKNVDSLVARLKTLDASKIKAVNKAVVDASRVELNAQRTATALAQEKLAMAKIKTEQARTAKVDGERYSSFANNTQALATKRSLDAEKIAQQRLSTAEKSASAATKNAESMAKQAAATVKTQYQNQLLQYTGNWAHQDNKQKNLKTDTAAAQLGVVQGRQDEILARTAVAQQRLNTETARGAKETANAAVSQQRLSTEQQRTANAATAAATAQQRLAAASSAASAAAARAAASTAAANARLSNVRSASSSASGGIRDLSSAMAQLDTSASFLRSDGLRWAKVMWALGGATLTAGAIVRAADAYTLLQNRLTVVAEKQEDVNFLTKEMFQIAERTRSPVAGVAKSFVRFDLALKEMGRTQKDTVVLTETVGKALQMSGATAGEAASAMLQLSQAFNKGKLDGDEFRSVMENAPLIAGALAKELGVTRGELLKLAPAGKLTVDQLTRAILNSSASIDEAFGKFKFTIAQSFDMFKNKMTEYLGELDKNIGFTQALSSLILGLAQNLDLLTFAFFAAAPAVALFVGTKILGGFGMLIGFLARTSVAIGAIRSPITVVSVGLANMLRQGIAAGAGLTAAFSTATGRAIGLQLAVLRATAGVLALGRAAGVMLAAFSFGNIVLILGTLVAAALAFGDKIEMAGEKSYTLRDVTIAAFSEMGGFITDVFTSIYDAATVYFGGVVDESETTGQKIGNTFYNAGLAVAVTIDAMTTMVSNLWAFLKSFVYFFGDAIYNVYTSLANMITAAVNVGISALNSLGEVANSILTTTGASALVGTFGTIGKLAAGDFSSNFLDSLSIESGYGNKHGVADAFVNDITPRVIEGAKKRKKMNDANGQFRGDDAAQAAKFAAANAKNAAKEKAKKAKKEKAPKKSAEEKRSDIIEKAMNAETKAIAVARQYGDERERVSVIEGINNKLKEKGYKQLTQGAGGEEAQLSRLVAQRLEAERTGSALQSMYSEAITPSRDFVAGQKAIAILLQDGVLSSSRAANMNDRLADSFAAATDRLYDMKKALEAQGVAQGKFGVDAEIATATKAAADSARSRGLAELTPDDVAAIDTMTRQLYAMKNVQEASQAVWEETYGTQEKLSYQIQAVGNGFKAGALGASEFTRQMAGLQAQQGVIIEKMYGLQDPFEPMRRGLYQLVAEMPSLGQSMADALQNSLGSAIDQISSLTTDLLFDMDEYAQNLADTLERPVSQMDVLKSALSDVVTMIGKELVTAIIKMGIQWAIQAALGKAIEATSSAATIATQTATAAAVQAAWTPAAISASIATLGSAAAIGTTAYLGAQAAGAASNLLPKFADGGEIFGAGTSRSDSIVARLSKGEHVVKADAAERNRPLLNAMNSGKDISSGGGDVYIDVNISIQSDGSVETDVNSQSQLANAVRGDMERVAQSVVLNMMKQGQPLYQNGRK